MILDTNALSALADGSKALEAAIAAVSVLSIPVIVLGEFEYGIGQSRHRARYERWLHEVLDVSRVLDVDRETGKRYARIRGILRAKARPIPANDAWIAALALQHALPVVSMDAHFDLVPNVKRIRW